MRQNAAEEVAADDQDGDQDDVLDEWTSALDAETLPAPGDDTSADADERPSDADPEPAPIPAEPPSEQPSEDRSPVAAEEDDDASGARLGLVVAVLLLLGVGGWFVITQTDLLSNSSAPAGTSPPAQTDASAPDASAPDESIPGEDEAEPAAATAAAGTSEAAASEPAAEASTDDAPSADEQAQSAPATVDPAEGGWTIIVASRTDRDIAASTQATFRDRFQPDLPTGLLTAASDGQTRYRVAVGQFGSRSAVLAAIDQYSDRLPEGAWALRLEPSM